MWNRSAKKCHNDIFFLNFQKRQYFESSNLPKMPQTSVTSVLSLPERDSGGIKSLNSEVKCLFCEKVFAVPNEQETFVVHLLEKHQFMVDKPRSITDFASYINYWRHKFENAPISDVCSILTSKVKQKGEPEKDVDFFMLSDLLQEDRELRIQLQQRRLEDVLEFHRKERQDASFKRDCLFCRTTYEGDYAAYLNHLAFDHNFSVGKPDNIVFVEDLLNVLEKKLEDLECVYCEKQFKNRDALKEHMRKKGHKKINPKNSSYDKFYVVNYQELDRNWEDISKEKDERGNFSDNDDDLPTGFESESDEDSAQDDRRWGDWVGQHSGAVCLFCPASYTEVPELLSHMTSIHDFDFKDIRNTLKLTFYQQVNAFDRHSFVALTLKDASSCTSYRSK